MTNGGNKNPNPLIDKLIVPIVLAFVVGGTSPWWFEPLTNTFTSRKSKDDSPQLISPNRETKPGNPSTDVSEPLEKRSTPELTTSVEKLEVYSVRVNDENEYSRSYSASNMTDSNVESYWRTKRGSILDVALDFSFDKPKKSLSQVNIYSSKDGGSYTQPVEVKLIFFDDSGEEITRELITLKGSSDQWQKYELDARVNNVSNVKIELGEPENNTARYIAINEIRFYGYE